MRALLRSDRGSGFPVLYIPGIDGTGELLLGTASRLEERFRLLRLAYEVEGPAEADSYEGLASSIARICEEEGIQRALLLAESFGGAVALQLALDSPDLVEGLMLVNSFAHFDRPGRLGFSRLVAPWIPHPVFDFCRSRFAPRTLFGQLGDDEALRAFRALPGAFFDHAYRRRLAMIAGLDLRPRLGEIRGPTALFASELDRVVSARRLMTQIAEGLPQATLEHVPRGGHLILPLAAQPWAERLSELLARK